MRGHIEKYPDGLKQILYSDEFMELIGKKKVQYNRALKPPAMISREVGVQTDEQDQDDNAPAQANSLVPVHNDDDDDWLDCE